MSLLCYLDLRALAPSPGLLGLLPRQVWAKYKVLPVALAKPERPLHLPPGVGMVFHRSGESSERLYLAMVDPHDPVAHAILAKQLPYSLVGLALEQKALDQFLLFDWP